MHFRNLSTNLLLKTVAALGLSLGTALAISCVSKGETSTSVNKPQPQTSLLPSQSTQMSETKRVENQEIGVEPSYTGEYINSTFGYKVIIPKALTGKGSPQPQLQHGFVINLSPENGAILSVDGSYNALLWRSLNEAYNNLFENLSDYGKVLEVEQKRKLLLDTHPAIWFTIRYIDKKTGEAKVTSQVISMRNCPGEDADIVYTIELDTSESRYTEDRVLMEKIFNSWKMLEKCN